MRLSFLLRLTFGVTFCALALNLTLLYRINTAHQAASSATESRDRALDEIQRLSSEIDLLAELAHQYTTTGEPLLLDVYQDILAVRSGERAMPPVEPPRWNEHWRQRISGTRPRTEQQTGPKKSQMQRLQALSLSDAEQTLANALTGSAQRLRAFEEQAFAGASASHGAAPLSKGRSANAPPAPGLQSAAYQALRADTSATVSRLNQSIGQRTAAVVAAATERLGDATRWLTIACLAMIPLVLLLVWAMRVRVMRPINKLSWLASEHARGNYAARSGIKRGRR